LPNAKIISISGSAGGDRTGLADADLPKGMHFPEFFARLRALVE
jgi:hypothetical protein